MYTSALTQIQKIALI